MHTGTALCGAEDGASSAAAGASALLAFRAVRGGVRGGTLNDVYRGRSDTGGGGDRGRVAPRVAPRRRRGANDGGRGHCCTTGAVMGALAAGGSCVEQ